MGRPVEYSPILTPLQNDDLCRIVGVNYVQFAKDRREGFVHNSAQHPYAPSPKFRFYNTFDAFSYYLFHQVLPPHLVAKRRYEISEAMTDLVAEFVERADHNMPREFKEKLRVNIIALAKECRIYPKRLSLRRQDQCLDLANRVLDAWAKIVEDLEKEFLENNFTTELEEFSKPF